MFGYRGTGFKPREGIPGVDMPGTNGAPTGIGLSAWKRSCAALFRDNAQPTRIQSITEGVLTYVQLPGTVFMNDARSQRFPLRIRPRSRLVWHEQMSSAARIDLS